MEACCVCHLYMFNAFEHDSTALLVANITGCFPLLHQFLNGLQYGFNAICIFSPFVNFRSLQRLSFQLSSIFFLLSHFFQFFPLTFPPLSSFTLSLTAVVRPLREANSSCRLLAFLFPPPPPVLRNQRTHKKSEGEEHGRNTKTLSVAENRGTQHTRYAEW